MSDFAEGLISTIAGGVQGGAEATGQIYEDERKNAARIETETQLAQAQAEIQLQKQKQLAVFAESQRREGKKADFEEEGKNLPETLRRGGLIESVKIDAEKAKWNDPEYRKARSLEEGITNPGGAGLRNIQTSLAQLQLTRAQEEAKIPAAVNKTLDSLNKRADILTTATARSDFDPTTDNGKKTIADLEGIHKQYADIVKPYLPKSEVKPGDGGKTVTQAQLEAGAKNANMTVEKFSAGLAAQGYKLPASLPSQENQGSNKQEKDSTKPTTKPVETYQEGIARQQREADAYTARKSAESAASQKEKEVNRAAAKRELEQQLETWQRANPNPAKGSNAYNRIEGLKYTLANQKY